MFITTKAEFIWDGEKYVETHTEGYEYEGELELAIVGEGGGGTGNTGYGGSTGGVSFPTLEDLLGMDIGSIFSGMGFKDEEISDYDYMVPEYDPHFANLAFDEYTLDLESIGLKQEGFESQMETATNLYDLTKESQSADLYSVTQVGEAKGYEAFGQESAALAGGLGGTRARRLSRMGKEAIETGVETESDRIRRAGEQSKVQYESAIDESERAIDALEISRQASLFDYEKTVGTLERDYEEEFWDFIGFLDEKGIKYDD